MKPEKGKPIALAEPNSQQNIQMLQKTETEVQSKPLFDENFLKKFSLSLALTLLKPELPDTGLSCNLASLNLEERLIPVENLLAMFKAQNMAGISPTLPLSAVKGAKKSRQGRDK